MKMIKHVILIDDDQMINLINSRVIQVSKRVENISSVTGGEEALAVLRNIINTDISTFPEFIFLDINMPDMDGWEFLDALAIFLRELIQNCKVVILTSSIDLFDIKKAKKNPLVFDYITKPLSIEKLRQLTTENHLTFSMSQDAIDHIGL